MQRPVLAANWKMHHGPTVSRAFVAAFLARFSPRPDRTVVLFPPALSVHPVVAARADRTDIKVGVQNIHTEEQGAFTGEISAPMSRDAGAEFVLVGHSERRHIFGETDAQVARKCAVAFTHGLTPVLCVGETLAQRESGTTNEVVLSQLRAGLADLDQATIRRVAIAYEPVWAIGTGRTATPADAASVHAVIRNALSGLAGPAASSVPILYGGSVNRQNAASLLAAPGVEGLLVGGASLDPEAWAAIAAT
jgi:triosephosphate isomerase (TIM)